jgi:deoxyxylulose-5-phosphate synthase
VFSGFSNNEFVDFQQLTFCVKFVSQSKSNIKFKSYCYPDKFIEHGSVNELEDKYGFNIEEIVEYIIKSVK